MREHINLTCLLYVQINRRVSERNPDLVEVALHNNPSLYQLRTYPMVCF